MTESKKATTTKQGAVDLEEHQLDGVTGGAGYIKIGDIEGESVEFSRDSLAQKVKPIGRLPGGSIRATKIK